MDRLVFTCGDVNGIGPEISVKLFDKILSASKYQIIFCCPLNVFLEACKLTSIKLEYAHIKQIDELAQIQNKLIVLDTGSINLKPGKSTASAGRIAFKALEHATSILINNLANALITAPISKQSMKMSGFNFPGHTEYLADKCGQDKFIMMFLSAKMKCALASIHIPISAVSASITEEKIIAKLDSIKESLNKDFGIQIPKVAVLGLNPHAGESGAIGIEESFIKKAINRRKKTAYGPFVPDAFFANNLYKNYDLVLGMYHDQILIPFKMLDFKKGVNYTAGLPFVRTSPDHGTGFDIAWQGKASFTSLESAFRWAVKISKSRTAR